MQSRTCATSRTLTPLPGTCDMPATWYALHSSVHACTVLSQARMYDQRLTFHPSHFVKLASPDDDYVGVSIAELELHSQVHAGFKHVALPSKLPIADF